MKVQYFLITMLCNDGNLKMNNTGNVISKQKSCYIIQVIKIPFKVTVVGYIMYIIIDFISNHKFTLMLASCTQLGTRGVTKKKGCKMKLESYTDVQGDLTKVTVPPNV